MARFAALAHRHGSPVRTAVLLVNLGTPDAPTAPALRRYLGEFLADPRVVEIPRLVWWPILHGLILPLRPAKSARKYASIWTADGSPLLAHTAQLATRLRGWLGEQGQPDVLVGFAMRYGRPAIAAELDRLAADGAARILVVPLYPQYAASTTASALDAVGTWLARQRNQPELRFVRSFAGHPGYIAALAASVREHWHQAGPPDRLVISFHGLPRRSLELGDPYYCECQQTGRLLAEALQLPPERFMITFQSRFGRAEWLQPYTQPTLEHLAREGTGRVDVICPGFVADCLETLEEIAMECKAAFLGQGGREFHYLPCLNERADWIAALGGLVSGHLGGWPLQAAADAEAAGRALRLGAAT